MALGLAPRAVPDFTDALVALKFLERDGDGPDAAYANSEEAALFLDRASPAYIGGFLEMAHDRLYPFWADLDEALQTGEAQNEANRGMASIFETVYSNEEGLTAVSGRDERRFDRQFHGSGREIRFLALPDIVRCRRGRRHALDDGGARQSPHALHHRRSAPGRAGRPAQDCRSRPVRSGRNCGGRFLPGRSAQGRCHHHGDDPPRLGPADQEDADRQGRSPRCRPAGRSSWSNS